MFQSGSIANAADGSAGVYRTCHNAPEFTYTLGVANGLEPSTDYIAVLHFAGECRTAAAVERRPSSITTLFVSCVESVREPAQQQTLLA